MARALVRVQALVPAPGLVPVLEQELAPVSVSVSAEVVELAAAWGLVQAPAAEAPVPAEVQAQPVAWAAVQARGLAEEQALALARLAVAPLVLALQLLPPHRHRPLAPRRLCRSWTKISSNGL